MDPKLKEAYDRVMATAVPPPSQPIPPQPQTPPPPVTPIHATMPIATHPQAASATIVGAMPKKRAKGVNIFPILFAVGGIVFFVVYTIFWLKFFNLSVPFLPF